MKHGLRPTRSGQLQVRDHLEGDRAVIEMSLPMVSQKRLLKALDELYSNL